MSDFAFFETGRFVPPRAARADAERRLDVREAARVLFTRFMLLFFSCFFDEAMEGLRTQQKAAPPSRWPLYGVFMSLYSPRAQIISSKRTRQVTRHSTLHLPKAQPPVFTCYTQGLSTPYVTPSSRSSFESISYVSKYRFGD